MGRKQPVRFEGPLSGERPLWVESGHFSLHDQIMEQDNLEWLTRWYEDQCNGDWEHGYGIAIDTLDNPGWSLRIDLNGTPLDGQTLERLTHNYEHDSEWWTCWTEDNQFHGAGGPQQLEPLIRTFREWVERS